MIITIGGGLSYIRFRLEMNVRSPAGLTSTISETQNYQDTDDGDMSRLQDIAPDWTYDYRRPGLVLMIKRWLTMSNILIYQVTS